MPWTKEALEEGMAIIERLCEMIASGCFPFTDDISDVDYSDYTSAFVDSVENMKRKRNNTGNKMLAHFVTLRSGKKK